MVGGRSKQGAQIEAFLNRINALDPLQDEAYPRLLRALLEGPSDREWLCIDLELFFPYVDSREAWRVTCAGLRQWRLESDVFDTAVLEGEHALLQEHTKDACELYFRGRSGDEQALLGALYERHREEVGDWIPFSRYFNLIGNQLTSLLAGGYGLLADGPTPLMEAYAAVLVDHEVRATILDSRPPKRRS